MTQTAFRVEEKTVQNVTTLSLFGYVDENAIFPRVTVSPTIIISLKACTGLNSVGTRKWIEWTKEMIGARTVHIQYCPLIFAKTFGQVEGTFRSNMVLDSVLAPFYSEATGEYLDVVLMSGIHFKSDGTLTLPDVADSAGNRMELDYYLELILKFLDKK